MVWGNRRSLWSFFFSHLFALKVILLSRLFALKVMDEEKVDEEANGFIQSFLLQPRQNANPPGSRSNVFFFIYRLKCLISSCKTSFSSWPLIYTYCYTGKGLLMFQHKRMKQSCMFSLSRWYLLIICILQREKYKCRSMCIGCFNHCRGQEWYEWRLL